MPPDGRSLRIMELGFRRLQGPDELALLAGLTNVYLGAGRVCLEDNFLAGWRFDLVGHVGT